MTTDDKEIKKSLQKKSRKNEKKVPEKFIGIIVSNTNREPIKDDVFICLDDRPSILKASEIDGRILQKMKTFIDIFINGMVG